MTERPIIFSAPMVRAILDGTKTQTRRVVKDRHINQIDTSKLPGPAGWSRPMPYGKPGDRLWVRETCRAHELTDKEAEDDTYGVVERLGLELPPYGLDGVVYLANGSFLEIENTRDASDKWADLNAYRRKSGAVVPAIHMPRWASRITLEIIGVRVERLQDISEKDAKAEGLYQDTAGRWETYSASESAREHLSPIEAYRDLWESINGPGSWDANPWVWVVEFTRHNAGIHRAAEGRPVE